MMSLVKANSQLLSALTKWKLVLLLVTQRLVLVLKGMSPSWVKTLHERLHSFSLLPEEFVEMDNIVEILSLNQAWR